MEAGAGSCGRRTSGWLAGHRHWQASFVTWVVLAEADVAVRPHVRRMQSRNVGCSNVLLGLFRQARVEESRSTTKERLSLLWPLLCVRLAQARCSQTDRQTYRPAPQRRAPHALAAEEQDNLEIPGRCAARSEKPRCARACSSELVIETHRDTVLCFCACSVPMPPDTMRTSRGQRITRPASPGGCGKQSEEPSRAALAHADDAGRSANAAIFGRLLGAASSRKSMLVPGR
ncbi:hypothetical protein BCR34DRAFT_302263 [Clohesyomyces aquaticus]|uniref:Uncharacterized protein n=1 Tax=Clohesyomyces aquaticus TaxID=1231657 RepID=A0A1Y1ZPX0_9PLEO|nr:hypothetical protein BCR34DRAFT_302263 [Clohesyomyces aquaticus]